MKTQKTNMRKQRKQRIFETVVQDTTGHGLLLRNGRCHQREKHSWPRTLFSVSSIISCSLLIVCFFSGCAVGPNYRAPQTKAPAQWNAPLAGGETNSTTI